MEKRLGWKEDGQISNPSSSIYRKTVPTHHHHHHNDSTGSKEVKKVVDYPLTRSKSLPAPEEFKLAATAISLNMRLRSADMPAPMQERALRYTRSLIDASPSRRPNLTLLARSLKKEFDREYGLAWHCAAGKSFGSFVTHSPGGFVYFSVDSIYFLLFKTEVHLVPN